MYILKIRMKYRYILRYRYRVCMSLRVLCSTSIIHSASFATQQQVPKFQGSSIALPFWLLCLAVNSAKLNSHCCWNYGICIHCDAYIEHHQCIGMTLCTSHHVCIYIYIRTYIHMCIYVRACYRFLWRKNGIIMYHTHATNIMQPCHSLRPGDLKASRSSEQLRGCSK